MRRLLYIVSILIMCSLITIGLTLGFLYSETVQTGLVRLATDQLSIALNTHASVGRICYRWPAKLELNDVYVADQQGDTLAYVGELYAHFNPKALLDNEVVFERIEINKVRAYAHKLDNGEYNYEWLIRAFAPTETNTTSDSTSTNIELRMPEITLRDIQGQYDEHTLYVKQIDLSIPCLQTGLDSVRARVNIHEISYRDLVKANIGANILLEDTIVSGELTIDSREVKLRADVHGSSIADMHYRADIEDVSIHATQIQDIVSSLQHRPFVLPKEIHRLGQMHYRGALEGTVTEAKLRGAIITQQGVVTTDAEVRTDSTYRWLDFKGRVGTRRFALGRMVANPEIGRLSAAVETHLYMEVDHFPVGTVKGQVQEFTFRNYTYRKLRIDGAINEGHATGQVRIEDENLSIDIAGLVNWDKALPEVEAMVKVHHFRPGKLRLINRYDDLLADLIIRTHIRGSNPDNLNGYLSIDTLYLNRNEYQDSILITETRIDIESEGRHKRFLLTGPLVTGKLEGDFEYQTLPSTVMKFAVQHVPGLFTSQQSREILSRASFNRLDGYLYGHELQHIQYFFDLPFRVANYPVLKFYLNEPQNLWGAQGFLSEFTTLTQQVKNITLNAGLRGKAAHVDFSADFSNGNYTLHTLSQGDSIEALLTATGDSALVGGRIHLMAHVRQEQNLPRVDVMMDSSRIDFNDSTYHIAPSRISYTAHNQRIAIHRFRFGTEHQFVEADGYVSAAITDTLRVRLGQIRGGYILSYILPEESLTVNGEVDGEAALYGILSKPTFDANVILRDAGLNGCRLGDAYASLGMDESGEHLVIKADLRDTVVKPIHEEDSTLVAHIDGLVDLVGSEGKWGLDIHAVAVPLAFLRHWTAGFLEGFDGDVSGDVQVFGRKGGTWVTAQALPHNVGITIPYTGCTYYVQDSCYMDSTSIRFPGMTLHDEEGNPMYLNGILTHDNFKDFKFDIRVNMDKALAIHMPDKAGELLQGKVYAGGEISVVGDDALVQLNADAHTAGNSRFRISIDGAGSAASNGFIKFVDHNVLVETHKGPDYSIRVKPMEIHHTGLRTKFVMGLNVEANRNLLFQLVLDDRTGDMIQANGSGALRMSYDDQTDKFGLTGTYTLEGGTLGFTLAGAFRRNFNIAAGSQIIFSGVPENPQLDVTAKYRVTASLKDLFGNETSAISKARTSIPVDVCVSMSGTLDDPTIRFALEFPSADDNIRQQVHSIINTEEMMMRQVVYLVAFGRFYTPDYMTTTGTLTGVNESFSLLSSTITGQINSWLSKLTDRVTLGVNIRNENGFNNAESSQEYEAQFQIQPISRILINGNLGYRYSQISQQPFYGDLDVEFLLTENGKFRLKGFTHMVDKYSLRQNNNNTIQGIGFVFKHDFNWRKETKTETKTKTKTKTETKTNK